MKLQKFSQPRLTLKVFTTTPKSFLGLRGFHNHPAPSFIRSGTYPPSVSLPTSGGSSTAPTRRSYIKVPSTHQRVGVIVDAT